MTELSERLRDEFRDSEYRHGYAHDFLDTVLAHQIRALRKQRGWTQTELATKAGTKQSFISAIESEEYGALSVSKLKDLAEAFDVYLSVRFESFARLLDDVNRSSSVDLEVPDFTRDPAFLMKFATTTTVESPIQSSPLRTERGGAEFFKGQFTSSTVESGVGATYGSLVPPLTKVA